ncbi:MAG: GspH/FimT family pseudopilin [Candidatus Anstonellales archaeon]
MKPKGFTLIELLIAIGILTILISVAVPQIMKYYRIYKYNEYVSQVEYTLKWAKVEAMARGVNLGICVENNSITVYDIGSNRSGYCSGKELRRVRVESRDSFVQITGTSGIGFDPRGLAIMGGNVQVSIQVKDTSTGRCTKFVIQTLRGYIRRESC